MKTAASPRATPGMRCFALAWLACLALPPSACGPSAPPPDPLTVEERADLAQEERDVSIEHLRSIGYVGWDLSADPNVKGVVRHEKDHVSPGFNFWTDEVEKILLTDLEGREIRSWRMMRPGHCEHAELLDDGGVVVVCVNTSLTRLDRDSKVVWAVKMPAHHDVAPVPDGSFLVPSRGEERTYQGRRVEFGDIVRVDASGDTSLFWSVFEHLDALRKLHDGSELDQPPGRLGPVDPNTIYDYYHLNTVEVLPQTPLGERDARFRAGNILICLRNANLILILDQDDLSVVWSWGPGELDLPHMPTMLEDGRILLFDNGTFRGYSRLVELDPASGDIVWSWQADPPERFFSKYRGGAQRLPNGNTLVCESEKGHVFELAPDGKIVWEFWNPEITKLGRKRIYRFTRLPPERVEGLLDLTPPRGR